MNNIFIFAVSVLGRLTIMEMLYHFLWKYRSTGRTYTLHNGKEVKVLSPGIHNNDAGPDFSNARLLIDDTIWVGNIELHIKASDWYKHGHDNDPAYDSVLLHIVAVDDIQVLRKNGEPIPTITLTAPPAFFEIAATLTSHIDDVRCRLYLSDMSRIVVEDWMQTLSIERIQQKAQRIIDTLHQCEFDWRQTIFITLARALGFGLNGIPFEMMAKSLPLNFVARHSDNKMQIEALLFGQAGMLDPSRNIFDEYFQALCREYLFLAKKYNLRPISPGMWKYSRTRPQNFPHRRIAILASFLYQGFDIIDKIKSAKGDIEKLSEIFSCEAGEYWLLHPSFGATCTNMPLKLSKSSINLLLINMAAPFYYAYGAMQGNPEVAEYGLDILRKLPSENNNIITNWRNAGIYVNDALGSQALIHLRKEYCDKEKCLNCRFGYQALKNPL